jgi:hypothetical protein
MNHIVRRQMPWQTIILCVLVCYPVMGSAWLPFGGGPRYLNVLVAPISLFLLWKAHLKSSIKPLLLEGLETISPFIPFAACWIFAQFWHQYSPVDVVPLSTVLWCGLLFVSARLVGVNHLHLARIAGIAAIAYGAIAFVEVFIMGRGRAWGGVYENRFGQYAIWLFAVCIIHAFSSRFLSKTTNYLLLFASLFGLAAAVLSGSRGALTPIPVLLLLLSIRSFNWRHSLLAMFLAVVTIAAGYYLNISIFQRFMVAYQETNQYFHESTFTPTSIGVRLELARVSMVTLMEHPLFGAGYLSLKQFYENHPNLGAPHPAILGIPGFHSDWFQVIGIGGGLLLLSLIVTISWLFIRAKNDPYLLLFLGFAVVFSFAELFWTHNLGLGLVMSCWALYSAAERNRATPYESNQKISF